MLFTERHSPLAANKTSRHYVAHDTNFVSVSNFMPTEQLHIVSLLGSNQLS